MGVHYLSMTHPHIYKLVSQTESLPQKRKIMKLKKEDILIRFEEYNKKYFDGVLPPCKCHVIRNKEHTPLGLYNPIKRRGKLIGHIWIASNVDWNEEDLREVIVHEMIHHYVRMIEGHKGGLFGHNWRFKRQCKRLKRDYGLNIHIISFNICRIGQKRPTNIFQKFRRIIYG